MKKRGMLPKRTPLEYEDINSVCYSVLSQNQLQNFAVLEITNDTLYTDGQPAKDGIFDLRMGISGPDQICQTCGQSNQCAGHFGYIKLEEPVLHYGYLQSIVDVLRCICHNCFRLKRSKDQSSRNKMKQIKRIPDPQKRLKLMSKLLQNVTKCNMPHTQQDIFDKNYKSCGYDSTPNHITIKNYKIVYIDKSNKKTTTKVIQRKQIKRLLKGISMYYGQCQAIGFTKTLPIDLIIQSIAVPPPQIRPYILIQCQQKCQDDLSFAYLRILRFNKEIKNFNGLMAQKQEKITALEKLIGSIMFKIKKDPNISAYKSKKTKNKIKSISQRLRGKQGRFRQNLLGKRVDFSARTVISPDPNLQLNQVGVPQKIARKLTYPQKVTPLNYQKILDLCLSHKVKILILPSESNIANQTKAMNVSKILASNRQQFKKYLTYGMIAQRVLQDGDYVLLNRQPTLHRMSMMSHRVKILPYNTFRINLSVCTPYNADFDGDEMNIHIPQSLQSICELKNISSVQNQIIGPKNATVTMGFTQDSLLGTWLLTSRDIFLNKQQIMNLLISIQYINNNNQQFDTFTIINKLPLPTIIYPQPLWTGKQLISLILPQQMCMIVKKQKNKKQRLKNIKDNNIIIKYGQLLSGRLQKQNIGTSTNINNIIHYIWIEKGSQNAKYFINNLQKIVYNWLTSIGFSLGASDIVPQPNLLKIKQNQYKQISNIYYKILNQYRDKKIIQDKHLHQQGKKIMDSFQYNVNLHLNNRLNKIQQIIKSIENSNNNNIYKIMQAKSKGSQTNLAQILYSVGNQNINGQRCPLGFSKRALPHFYKQDYSPIARGYVISSFYQGLKPEELFFHSMGGREGLSDTAIKTSHVGYIQRKIVKSLEDLIVKYDSSVRDAKNNILQTYYGEDGFMAEKIEKHKFYGGYSNKDKFRQIYKWKDDQLKRQYRHNIKQIKQLKKQYSELYKNRKIYKQIFCNNTDKPTYQYYCPISVQKIVNKIKINTSTNSTLSDNKRKKYNNTTDLIKPGQIYETVQKLLKECIMPPEKYQVESKKRIEVQDNDQGENNQKKLKKQQKQKKDDYEYESFSDQFQRQDQDLQKILHKKYTQPHKIKQLTSFDIFKLHLRFSLSSKLLCKNHNLTKQQFHTLISQIKQKYYKSLAPAGQSVGCLASQSICQPTTQMTLNTFHLAGISDRNVTLGLPRLQQLLNCKNIQNPIITIYPSKLILQKQKNNIINQHYLLEMLTYYFSEHKIQDFIQSIKYYYNPQQLQNKIKKLIQMKGKKNRTGFKIQINFNNNKIRSQKIWNNIVSGIQKLCKNMYEIDQIINFNQCYKQNKCKISLRYINSNNSSSKQEQVHYKQGKLYDKQNQISNKLSAMEILIKQRRICGIKGISSVKISTRTLNLISSDNNQSNSQNSPQKYIVLQATGNNFKQILQHPQINPTKTTTNNIIQILQTLGIQASRQALINQFKQILKPYGIIINYRHLSILVDWMCNTGRLISINRYGLNKLNNISTLTKASFQQSMPILLNSALFGIKDQIRNTTQKIIFGQNTKCGTYQCQLMIDPQKVKDYVCKPQQQINNKLAETVQDNIQGIGIANRTPMYGYSTMYDNDVSRSLNNSYMSQYSKSPNYISTTPILSFSPVYSTSDSLNFRNLHMSPKYDNTKGGKTDITTRSNSASPIPINSPLYNNNSTQHYNNIRNIASPLYNIHNNSNSNTYNYNYNKQGSPTINVLNRSYLPSVGEHLNKDEEYDDQTNTKIIGKDQEDQF